MEPSRKETTSNSSAAAENAPFIPYSHPQARKTTTSTATLKSASASELNSRDTQNSSDVPLENKQLVLNKFFEDLKAHDHAVRAGGSNVSSAEGSTHGSFESASVNDDGAAFPALLNHDRTQTALHHGAPTPPVSAGSRPASGLVYYNGHRRPKYPITMIEQPSIPHHPSNLTLGPEHATVASSVSSEAGGVRITLLEKPSIEDAMKQVQAEHYAALSSSSSTRSGVPVIIIEEETRAICDASTQTEGDVDKNGKGKEKQQVAHHRSNSLSGFTAVNDDAASPSNNVFTMKGLFEAMEAVSDSGIPGPFLQAIGDLAEVHKTFKTPGEPKAGQVTVGDQDAHWLQYLIEQVMINQDDFEAVRAENDRLRAAQASDLAKHQHLLEEFKTHRCEKTVAKETIGAEEINALRSQQENALRSINDERQNLRRQYETMCERAVAQKKVIEHLHGRRINSSMYEAFRDMVIESHASIPLPPPNGTIFANASKLANIVDSLSHFPVTLREALLKALTKEVKEMYVLESDRHLMLMTHDLQTEAARQKAVAERDMWEGRCRMWEKEFIDAVRKVGPPSTWAGAQRLEPRLERAPVYRAPAWINQGRTRLDRGPRYNSSGYPSMGTFEDALR